MSTGSLATKQRMTAEEFFDLVHRPENSNKWFELVRGQVIELPPPQKIHGFVSANSVLILGNYNHQRRKGYVTGNDSGVILERDPDTVRGPDAALYEDADRFEDLHPKYGEVPPRLAVEVLSPSDRADRITRKIMDYLNNGVDMVWLIDPENRTITVYRPDKGPRLLEENEELTGNDVLPGFRCLVADFFFLPQEHLEQKTKPTRKRRRNGKASQ
jgi:Uma2 family endonuclease